MSRGSRRLVLLAAGCACAVIGVSAASAGHHHHHHAKLKYVSERVALPTGQGAAATADCPKGTSVTGGGSFASGPNGGYITLNSSSPEPAGGSADPRKGWIGYAANTIAGPQTFDVYAICSSQKSKLSYVSNHVDLPNGNQGASAIAKCRKGTSVIGGGTFESGPNDGTIQLTSSSPEPVGGSADPTKGWIGYANNASGSDQTLFVYAICSSQKSRLKYVSSPVTLPEGNQGASAIAKCPKGTSVAGGGTFASGPNDGNIVLTSSSPEPAGGSADPTKGWIGYATDNESGSDQKLVVSAICMKQ